MRKIKIKAFLITQGLRDTIQPTVKKKEVKMSLHPSFQNKKLRKQEAETEKK